MISNQVPIRAQKLPQIVEDRLLELIREKQLRPGDNMPSERELMALYQVGRPAVREAMQNLQRMGLVEIRHGERPKIAEPTLQSLVDQMGVSMQHILTHSEPSFRYLKEARATLEAEMARIAARQRTDADIKKLRRILDQQTANRSNPQRFVSLDGEFHRSIAGVSRNPIMESVTFAIFGWLSVFHVDQVRKQGLEALTLEEHAAILTAIEAGDESAAAEAMRNHLTRANDLYHQTNPGSSAS
ncbi:MAG: transcriptional regulator NanR [Rhodobacteraceae bacterium]|nr:transcriptional regulator NanR [Paracoccaceae bacterium]